MKISVVSFSLTDSPSSIELWKEKLLLEVSTLLKKGADLIVFPELFHMGLDVYFSGSESERLIQISNCMKEVVNDVQKLITTDVLICLGSGPDHRVGRIFNSSPLISKSTVIYQDKIHLTPWETSFTPGNEVVISNWRGLKLATLICFDIEQPSLALALKEAEVDLILCPTATTNRNGSDRVNRCASSRAVELGAIVITTPLVGTSKCELVDENEGRQGFFLPAQDDVLVSQEVYSSYSKDLSVLTNFEYDLEMHKKMKAKTSETKPYHKLDQKVKIKLSK